MIIKYQDLIPHLQKKMPIYLYVLIGSETYMIEDSIRCIKNEWQKQGDYDEKSLAIQHVNEWQDCFQEANHYNLFAPYQLLKIRYDKKSLDTQGLNCIKHYLENPNPHCLILLEAPQLNQKSLQWLGQYKQAVLLQASPLNSAAFTMWIKRCLQEKSIHFEANVPHFIQQYNQNNMLAVWQFIEKLSLQSSDAILTTEILSRDMVDQCTYSLYELADACLIADKNKALHLLRYLNQNKTEPTLVLWLITQEIKLLSQWQHLVQQKMPTEMICKQLNIWSQRMRGYTQAIARLDTKTLYMLLAQSHQVDKQIKSLQSPQVWQGLELLVMAMMEGTCIANHQ